MKVDLKYMSSKFLDNVAKLELKFPVAEIAKKTGAGKGNVSKYLKTGKASDNFLITFYGAFGLPTCEGENENLEMGDLKITMKDYVDEILSTKKLLADLLKTEVSVIKTNSDIILEKVLSASRVQIARTEEMMKALDKMTGVPEGTLGERADMIEESLKSADELVYKTNGVNK